MREALQISRREWPPDLTRFEALGAKDIVCKHCFRQIVEIVRECLLCDRKPIPAA